MQHAEALDELCEPLDAVLLRVGADPRARIALGEVRRGAGLDAQLCEESF